MTFDRTKLPLPNSKNVFQFDGKTPEDLGWYLEQIDDFIETYKANSDEDKKFLAARYAAPRLSRDWKKFASYDPAFSYEEFCHELYENYPEAKEAEEGSIMQLSRLVKSYSRSQVSIDEPSEYMALVRKLRGIVEKLKNRVANHEIVASFLDCLEEDFVRAIKTKLRSMPRESLPSTLAARKKYEELVARAKASNQPPPLPIEIELRPADDKYRWEDLVKIAQEISEEESVSFYGSAWNSRVVHRDAKNKSKQVQFLGQRLNDSEDEDRTSSLRTEMFEKFNDLEKTMAEVADKRNADDHKRHVETAELLRGIGNALQHGGGNSQPPRPAWNNQGRPANGGFGGRGPVNQDCYYCGGSHFQSECDVRREHILSGVIKVIDGKPCMYDGHNIPGEPRNKSKAIRAQEYYAARHNGKLPPSVREVHYQGEQEGEDEDPNYDPREDEILTLKVEAQQLRQQLLQAGLQNGQVSILSNPNGSGGGRSQFVSTRTNPEASGEQVFR